MVGLGLDAPGPHLFGQAMGRGEDEGICLAEELNRSRGFAAASAAAYVAQARCWERGPFLLLYSQAWRSRLHVPRACIAPRPYHWAGATAGRYSSPSK